MFSVIDTCRWTSMFLGTEVDDIIKLHGNLCQTRTVDGIELELGEHIEDAYTV